MQERKYNLLTKKIKILQFPIANSNGGITHYALGNWKWMDKEQFQCDFVTMSKYLSFEDEVLATGSKVFHLSCYAEENKEQFKKEFDAILDEEYDVVHLHTKQWKSFLVEEICKKHGIPKVIVHAHSTGIETLDLNKREQEERLHEQVRNEFNENLATDFWACSRQAADFLFGEQISRNRIKIIPNAIELDKFVYNQAIREQYRKEYKLEDTFVIGHVGRFVYAKNHQFLLDCFTEISKKICNVKLVLVGEGELFQEIQKQVQYMKIEDDVLFLGLREDISNWYQAMDMFCLPSRFEGFPLAMIEAQAAGLFCVGSEKITSEVEISENIIRLPLVIGKWVEQVLNYYNNYWGKEQRMQVINEVYDIRNQIKIIQELYKGGVIIHYSTVIFAWNEVCA